MKSIQILALIGLCAGVAIVAGCQTSKGSCCLSDCQQASGCPSGVCMAKPVTASAAETPAATEGVVNTAALAALLRAKAPVTVLDARTGKYDDGRRVPGAKALSPAAADAEIAAALPDKKALIVTYCSGLKCPACHLLGEKLRGKGYANVLEYHEGIDGWAAAGNAVEPATK